MEEGYAAVTSRRVGAAAGLKPQLVHYYFRTMDDLYLEVFRRRAEANLAWFEQEISRDGSLRHLWQLNSDPRGAAFTIEFTALANHRKEIRAEIARYAERFRRAQVAAVQAALAAEGFSEEQVPPIVAQLVLTGLAQIMTIEETIGVTAGHDTTRAWVEQALASLAAGRRPMADATGTDGRRDRKSTRLNSSHQI